MPKLEGAFAPNDKLASVEWLARGKVIGPEATAIDAAGRVYTGTRDGKVVRLSTDLKEVETFAVTGGRPLGMQFAPSGDLIVCDAVKGLLSISKDGAITTLATQHAGVPFKFTDDVDVAQDGTIYFTDATSKFDVDHYVEDAFEHRGNGRFLAYHPDTKQTELLEDGLFFANGVALSADESFVVVNETFAYRIKRRWLKGPKRGTSEVLIDNLPGFPDNVTFSKTRNVFWVALFAPRDAGIDALAPLPALRKVVWRLPHFLQPRAKRFAFVIGVDEQGKVVQNLQHDSPDSFSPVTSAREHDGWLYLGSLMRDAVGRVRAP
jgi:sugar lactone lactonase YvrE